MIKSIIYLILIFTVQLCADTSGVRTGEWMTSQDEVKLFRTPIGYVYTLPRCAHIKIVHPSELTVLHERKYGVDVKIDGLLQFSFLKNNEKNKRFVIIDFKVRSFAALPSDSTADFLFCLAFSAMDKIPLHTEYLNSMLSIASVGPPYFEARFRTKEEKVETDENYPYLRPSFQPISFRIIIDLKDKNVAVSYNGQRITPSKRLESKAEKWEIRSVGILVHGRRTDLQNSRLEISPPVVRQFDSLEELERLPPFLFEPYPYNSYLSLERKKNMDKDDLIERARKHSNPDYQYVAAMKLIYGDKNFCDPVAAVDLLEKAVRQKHVLAMYQLGVCLYRGYGVVPDISKSLKYVQESAWYNYSKADALYWFIQWDSAYRPIFQSGHFMEIKREGLPEISKYHVYDHDRGFVNLFRDNTSAYSPEISPKYSRFDDYAINWVNRDHRKKPLYFIDQAINSGYAPAYAAKARRDKRLRLVNDKFEEETNWPDKDNEFRQLLSEGVRNGDKTVLPELMLELARKKQLPAEYFSNENNQQFSRHALYQILFFHHLNPQFPGIADYLSDNSGEALSKLRKINSADSELLQGLIKLVDKDPAKVTLKEIKTVESEAAEAFRHLLKAANMNNTVAQYLVGYYALREDLPSESIKIDARLFLERAARNGHPHAAMLMAEFELNRNNPAKALEYLTKPCELNIGEAYYLRGNALGKMGNRKQEMLDSYQQAIHLGDHRGRRELALHSGPSASDLWFNFIQADCKVRENDPCDPYYPDIYSNLYQWIDAKAIDAEVIVGKEKNVCTCGNPNCTGSPSKNLKPERKIENRNKNRNSRPGRITFDKEEILQKI